MFPQVVKIARILGPLGLMPSPGKKTVGQDITLLIQTARESTRLDQDDLRLSCIVGKTDWTEDLVQENIKVLVNTVKELKPKVPFGQFVSKVALTTPFGIGMELPERPFK
jgi:large subunit ribosomal protein L1